MYKHDYDDAIQSLAENMLDKIATELDYEDEMERTALTLNAGKVKEKLFGGGKGNNFDKASSGIRSFIQGKSPQKKVQGFANMTVGDAAKNVRRFATSKPMIGVAGTGVGYQVGKKINANGQEKAAEYFEQAEMYKQAAEEAYQEALAMEAEAIDMFNYFDFE